MGEEEPVMGNSIRWTGIYVYAVGRLVQSEGKLCGESQLGRANESNMDQFDGQQERLGLKNALTNSVKQKVEL